MQIIDSVEDGISPCWFIGSLPNTMSWIGSVILEFSSFLGFDLYPLLIWFDYPDATGSSWHLILFSFARYASRHSQVPLSTSLGKVNLVEPSTTRAIKTYLSEICLFIRLEGLVRFLSLSIWHGWVSGQRRMGRVFLYLRCSPLWLLCGLHACVLRFRTGWLLLLLIPSMVTLMLMIESLSPIYRETVDVTPWIIFGFSKRPSEARNSGASFQGLPGIS